MTPRLIFAASLAALSLAACQAKTQQSVENQFQQTQASIENTANSLENTAEVSTRAAANEVEAQANSLSNRIDAVDRAAQGAPVGNVQSNSTRGARTTNSSK